MLCNIKSLTSRCLAGGGHRWISVSQTMKIYVRTVGGVIKWSESEGRIILNWTNNYFF